MWMLSGDRFGRWPFVIRNARMFSMPENIFAFGTTAVKLSSVDPLGSIYCKQPADLLCFRIHLADLQKLGDLGGH